MLQRMRPLTCLAFLFVVAGCEPGDTEVAQKPDAAKTDPSGSGNKAALAIAKEQRLTRVYYFQGSFLEK